MLTILALHLEVRLFEREELAAVLALRRPGWRVHEGASQILVRHDRMSVREVEQRLVSKMETTQL